MRLTLRGIDEAIAMVDAEKSKGSIQDAEAAARFIANHIAENAHVKTGQLRNSVHIEASTLGKYSVVVNPVWMPKTDRSKHPDGYHYAIVEEARGGGHDFAQQAINEARKRWPKLAYTINGGIS